MRITVVSGFILAFIIFVVVLINTVEKDKSIQPESSETITIE